jgi:hypothetical protein
MNETNSGLDRIITEINALMGLTISRETAERATAYVRSHPASFAQDTGMSTGEAADLAVEVVSGI